MASGVAISDEVVNTFQCMKVRKSSTPEEVKKRKKAVIFCLSEDKKCVVLEKGKEILVGDCDKLEDPYLHFVQMLPECDCRYALYDATYETKDCKKEEIVFLMWAPEGAPIKAKMVYASSKDALKKKLQGIKHEIQANCQEEVRDRSALAEKLGGSCVISLEGKPL